MPANWPLYLGAIRRTKLLTEPPGPQQGAFEARDRVGERDPFGASRHAVELGVAAPHALRLPSEKRDALVDQPVARIEQAGQSAVDRGRSEIGGARPLDSARGEARPARDAVALRF